MTITTRADGKDTQRSFELFPQDVTMTDPGTAPAPWSKQQSIALLCILLLAGGLRLYLSFQREYAGYDEANYVMIARNADAGLGYTQSTLTEYQPKFHLLAIFAIQGLSRLMPDGLVASKTLFVVGGLVGVLLIALLGRALFGRREGLLAALYFAVAPALTSLTAESLTHSLFIPLYLLTLWLVWRALTTAGGLTAAAAGLSLGLAWWARADGLVAFPCLLLFFLVGGALLGRIRRALINAGVFALSFGIVYWLYSLVVQWLSGGRSAPHSPLSDFLLYPPVCQPNRDLASYGSLLELVVAEPGCVFSKVLQNLDTVPSVFFTWTGMSVVLVLFVGFALASDKRPTRRALARDNLLLFGTLPLAGYLFFYIEETRYVSPYVALALIWCARGALSIGSRLEPLGKRSAIVTVPLLLCLLLLITTHQHALRMEVTGGKELLEAGSWVAQNADPDAVLWTFYSQVALVAERPWRHPPRPLKAGSWTQGNGTQVLLVVDGRTFEIRSPEWADVLAQQDPEGLRLLFRSEHGALSYAIYEVQEPWLQSGR